MRSGWSLRYRRWRGSSPGAGGGGRGSARRSACRAAEAQRRARSRVLTRTGSYAQTGFPLRSRAMACWTCWIGSAARPFAAPGGRLSPRCHMARLVTRVSKGGRVVIPAQYRKALGLNPGDEVILLLEEGAIRSLTPREAARRAQALVRFYIPAGRRLADELIAERRQEARRE